MTSRPSAPVPHDSYGPGASDDGADGLEAARRAQEVVGLYGDPDVTWGISLEAVFSAPVDLSAVAERLQRIVREHPHLGVVPEVERVGLEEWAGRREMSVSAPFDADGRLVRGLADVGATRFVVIAHHGVCDGLGLVALMSAVTGRELVSSARGVGDTPASQGFLLSSLLRLGEALLTPPTRFSGTSTEVPASAPERMIQADALEMKINSARVTSALLRVHGRWPRRRSSGGRRFLTVMGASRRDAGTVAPDRQTAYLRIPLKSTWSSEEVAQAMKDAIPEPDFPETSAGGIGPMITRALKNRLGYTVNVSNLGLVRGEGLRSMAMFPAVNGPQAVSVGLVSTPSGATVSLRTRRGDFTDAEATSLLGQVIDELEHL